MAQVTGYAGLSALVGEVMLYTGPEQHCANRGALLIPKGGVLQTSPGRFSGHSEKAPLETSLKVGLPVQWLAAIDACAGGGSVDCQGEENHDSGNFQRPRVVLPDWSGTAGLRPDVEQSTAYVRKCMENRLSVFCL